MSVIGDMEVYNNSKNIKLNMQRYADHFHRYENKNLWGGPFW